MNVVLIAFFILFLLFSQNALAHLKWFVSEKQTIEILPPYDIFSVEVIVGTLLCFFLLIVAIFLNKKVKPGLEFSEKTKGIVLRLFSILVGISLLAAAYSETVIASHYYVTNEVLLVLQYAQAIVGLMFIFGIFIRVASIVFIIIYLALSTQFGFLELLDYLNIIGISAFLILHSLDSEKLKSLAVPVLRILTGAALIVLAFSEKLLDQNMGVSFLLMNDWNFMQALGVMSYSHSLFVLSAGFVELLIGMIFVLGILTRINTLVLLAFMITSNTMFLVQNSLDNAFIELAGHLPVLAIALVLLTSGAGEKWKLH